MGTGLTNTPVALQTGKGQNISIYKLVMEPTSSKNSSGRKCPCPTTKKTQNILKSKFLYQVHFPRGKSACIKRIRFSVGREVYIEEKSMLPYRS